MEANLAVDIDDGEVTREDIDAVLDEITEVQPDIEIELVEPKEALPTLGVGETLTLIIAINSSVQLFACIYPRIRDLFSELGGDTDILDTDELAKGYLDEHTRVTRDKLDLSERSFSGDYVIYVFEYLEDGSEHYIKINQELPTEWEYKER